MMNDDEITIRAISDWMKSLSDAEDQCSDRLAELANNAISSVNSNNGVYVGGSTSGFDVEHDQGRDEYRCSAEQTLYFIYPETDKEEFDFGTYHEKLFAAPPVDISAEILSMVKAKLPPSIMGQEYIRVPSPGSSSERPIMIRIPRPVALPLTDITILNVEVVSSDLSLSPNSQTVNIPYAESVFHMPYENCGSERQSITREFTFKIIKGWKIELTKRISSTTKIGGKLKFGSVGEASFERSITTDITRSSSMSETREESQRTTLNFQIPANKVTTVKVTIQSFEARRSFEGPIVLDCDIVAVYKNQKHKHRLSSLLAEVSPEILYLK